MQITDYHAKYYAHALSLEGGSGIERISRSLFDACVDLNPHQVEASLFALRSPISKGVLLADEVGLGKTIEAGIVICQYWAERKRKILIISPASLRKQWAIELEEKFNIATKILDSRTYKYDNKNGKSAPFNDHSVVICSMHYAGRKAEEIKQIPWDLVVIDEAHKLKNVYRQSNKIGRLIQWATKDCKKILLTATPLQNSLLELYGLSTLIDERLFGDLPSFRTQYIQSGGDLPGLRERLVPFCWRTLRRQVLEYVRYTERKLITRPFKPTEQEQRLYEAVSDFLQREDNYALPSGQRHLLILLVRKVLASSPRAVAGTLEIIRNRLIKLKEETERELSIVDRVLSEVGHEDDLLDEILEDEEDLDVDISDGLENSDSVSPDNQIDLEKLDKEIAELNTYIAWARSISIDTKAKTLHKALKIGFNKMEEMGAAQKAVIFTESQRTQYYLKEFLDANGYLGKTLTYNGTNNDIHSKAVYEEWLDNNKESGRISGSKSVDIRTAIIEKFQNQANILIATEAAAEGINLQFCSLVINFDLPWNPQRVEQRIGRCHRYGQKYDVVVINFLNEKNQADKRVYELLQHKFNLFSGVFGASDEILGSIESGIDFERKVLDIYQQCRTSEEIEQAFSDLQKELDEQIQAKMQDTRQMLLENFDEDVHERLKVNLLGTKEYLDRIGRMFWDLTKKVLHDHAKFEESSYSFELFNSPLRNIPGGQYHLISKEKNNNPGRYLYRLSHPLGQYVISEGLGQVTPPVELSFDISNHPTHISVVERLKNKTGWLSLHHLRIDSLDRQEFLLFSGFDNEGHSLDQETCEKLFSCGGSISQSHLSTHQPSRLDQEAQRHTKATLSRTLEDNNRHFNEARDQLDKWADDMELAAQKELDDTKRQIRELQRLSRQAENLEEQHELQEKIVKLERKKRKLRQNIFDVEDKIAEKRDQLLEALEQRMEQKTEIKHLFTIKWKVI